MTSAPAPAGVAAGPRAARAGHRAAAAPGARPLAATELRHGYTLGDLARLAQHTASHSMFDPVTAPATKYEVTFAAIVQHRVVYTRGEPVRLAELSSGHRELSQICLA